MEIREFYKRWRALKKSIWLFLYYLSLQERTVKACEVPWAEGLTYRQVPCRDLQAASAMKCSVGTIGAWRRKLARLGYIRQRRTAAGYIITIPGVGGERA
jgi:hypothetical protein